ncbi:MAG: response regulator [Fretibacterium sp.]|nr:response regulator [Fretibacterium sp.]
MKSGNPLTSIDSDLVWGRGKRMTAVTVSIVFSLVVMLAGYFYFLDKDIQQERERCGFIAENEAEHIVMTIDCVMTRTRTLTALVQGHKGNTDFFSGIASIIYHDVQRDTGVTLKNIALAPNGIVSEVYPYVVNKSLIGFNFLDTSLEGNQAALDAYEQGHTILTNPFKLMQGGTGMAGRAPVLIEQMEQGDRQKLWGLVTVTIDFENLIKVLKLDNLIGMGMDYQLSYLNKDGSTHVMHAHGPKRSDAVRKRFLVKNLTWEIAIIPHKGWYSVERCVAIIVIICILSAFVGSFISMLIKLHSTNIMLRRQSELAAAASEAKSSFLSNMSHEIRTPINAVLGMNEMILRESGEQNVIDYSENIRTAGNTLLGLVNDILDFSKIEAGKMEILPVDYDISSLINDLVNMIQARIDKKGLSLKLEFDEEMPKVLHGDEVRIKQVVTNILTNAVKYTEKGSVTFHIGYERIADDPEGVYLDFSISDTGIGIKPEDMTKLFSEFERIEEKRNRSIEGTGLGMNITKRLLEMMGTSLKVESIYGEGSTFSFRLRQKVLKWEALGNYEASYRTARSKRQKYREKFTAPDAIVLMVDDTPMNLTVFKSLLKQTKVQVDTAESANEGLALTRKKKYDIVFLDHMMPEKDGIDALHELREEDDNPNLHTTAICLTANAISGAREQYLAEGFDDYLTKPIDVDKLEEMMMRYLPEEKIITQTADDNAAEEEPPVELPDWLRDISEIDIDSGLQHCGGGENFLDMLKIYGENTAENADGIENFWRARDLANTTIKVHALKSTSRAVGAEALGALAEKLEFAGKAGDEAALDAELSGLLERYRALGAALSPLYTQEKKADEEDLPLISDDELRETYDSIRDFAANFDSDSMAYALEYLDGFRIPEGEKERVEQLRHAIENFNRSRINEILS